MEDYIQGILCGYLVVQNGTNDEVAKRRRVFAVLSDTRMDYYLTDPRPAFAEDIAGTYTFDANTQVHPYVEINPRAPQHSFCLITDKVTDVLIAESARDAETWIQHLHERLGALSQVVSGHLMLRKEVPIKRQLQRALLQTKYTWSPRFVQLGRSAIRYCAEAKRTTRLMKQFQLTSESYVSEEPVEVLKMLPLVGWATSAGSLSAPELKRLQRDPKLQEQRAPGGGSVAFPFVVCTGPAHMHLVAPTDKVREEWLLAIRMRIIALKYRHNKASAGEDPRAVGLHGFMEVQFVPGGPWKRRYVELQNEILKVKANDRTLGATFETHVVPTCYLTPSLLKANAFSVRNLGQEIGLAPGSLPEAQAWMQAIRATAAGVPPSRYQKVFSEQLRGLLDHSVAYALDVPAGASAGLVVERHKKRIVVLSHDPTPSSSVSSAGAAEADYKPKKPTPPQSNAVSPIPQGSVLVGITQLGMVHDSFETIWHKLRQKKGFAQHPMRLTFRAPLTKRGLVGVRLRHKDPWALCQCVLEGGKLRIEALPPPPAQPPTTAAPPSTKRTSLSTAIAAMTAPSSSSSSTATAAPGSLPVVDGSEVLLLELPLRDARLELETVEEAGVRNAMKLTMLSDGNGSRGPAMAPPPSTIYLQLHHDDDLVSWYAFLQLEIGIAQDDDRYPLTMEMMRRAKPRSPSPLGVIEDQRRSLSKFKLFGRALTTMEQNAQTLEPKLLQQARLDGTELARPGPPASNPKEPVVVEDVAAVVAEDSEEGPMGLTEADSQRFFQHLDVIGCGKISSAALDATLANLTRHLGPSRADAALGPLAQGLREVVPVGRPFVSINADQAHGLLRRISEPGIVALVRKFSQHDVQCM